MNGRIKELAERAGLRVESWMTNPPKPFQILGSVEEFEKFAELFVKDCASLCEIEGQSYKHSFTPAKARLAESTSNHCATMIKRHFGVE
jgi:hypothetical protein